MEVIQILDLLSSSGPSTMPAWPATHPHARPDSRSLDSNARSSMIRGVVSQQQRQAATEQLKAFENQNTVCAPHPRPHERPTERTNTRNTTAASTASTSVAIAACSITLAYARVSLCVRSWVLILILVVLESCRRCISMLSPHNSTTSMPHQTAVDSPVS